MRHWTTTTALVLALVTVPAAAEHPCAAIGDDRERLACYDAAFGPQAAARQGTAAAAPAGRASAEFGLSPAEVLARDPERARHERPESIEAQVVTLRRRSTGDWLVALDNGQSWLVTDVASQPRLAPGDRVTVRRAALGSFQLVTPGRVALRVRRLE